MTLRRKITLAFGIGVLITVGTLLLGVPYVLSEVSMRQMTAHTRTFGLFLRNNLASLSVHEPGLFVDPTRSGDFRTLVESEFSKAEKIASLSGSFAVLSIDLLGPERSSRIIWGNLKSFPAGQDPSVTASDLIPGTETLRQDVMNGVPVPQVEELIVPIDLKEAGVWAVRMHLDFQKSMKLHEDQYLTFQVGSIAVLLAILISLLSMLLHFLSTTIVRPASKLSAAMVAVGGGDLDVRFDHVGNDEFGVIEGHFNSMVKGLREKRTLGQYVSQSTRHAVSRAIQSGQKFHRPERKDVVVFFSDIRGFTSFSEKNDPEVILKTLNRILDLQASVIFRNGGDIDKFVGDETMAVFADRESAFLSALTIQILMKTLYSDLAGLTLGIGICHGPVVQGDVGVESMRDFTVIGNTVNIASRLQSLALGGEILVPQAAMNEILSKKFRVRLKGVLTIKGKEKPMRVVSLVGTVTRASEEAKEQSCSEIGPVV